MRLTIRKRTLKLIAVIGIALAVLVFYLTFRESPEPEQFNLYSEGRGPLSLDILASIGDESINVQEVSFPSIGVVVHGLLFSPANATKTPGVIILPGAGVDKFGEIDQATLYAQNGYTVLVLDQRGHGDTGGLVRSVQQDFQVFLDGEPTSAQLMVYDSLRAFDALGSLPGVDKDDIAFVGLSLGGRIAMIAASAEPGIRGVVAIASSGFNADVSNVDVHTKRYLEAIDPDFAVAKISPRRIAFVHEVTDSVVPQAMARSTYDRAREPKAFYSVSGCGHGYCPAMNEHLLRELALMLNQSFK